MQQYIRRACTVELSLLVSQANHCLVSVGTICVAFLSLGESGKSQKRWLSLLCIHRAVSTSCTVKVIAKVNFVFFFLLLGVGVSLSLLHKVYSENLGRMLLTVASKSIKSWLPTLQTTQNLRDYSVSH